MKKSDLKPCMVVKLRDGRLAMLAQATTDIILSLDFLVSASRLSRYDDNLKHCFDEFSDNGNSNYDIVAVYGFANYNAVEISTKNRDLLWEEPKWTYKDEFLKRCPKAKIRTDGTPFVCKYDVFGGAENCIVNHRSCWNEDYICEN